MGHMADAPNPGPGLYESAQTIEQARQLLAMAQLHGANAAPALQRMWMERCKHLQARVRELEGAR